MEFEKISEIIADKQDIDTADIKMESTLEELKIDSLTMVEIVMDIEEAFDITVELEDAKTVADVVNYVAAKKNG